MDARIVLELTAPFLSRQMQVLLLWLLRFSYREIARAMQIEHRTVNSHLDQLQDKWGLESRAELCRVAMFLLVPYIVKLSAMYGNFSPYNT